MNFKNIDSLKKEYTNWNFTLTEISNNIYSIDAKRNTGHQISYRGAVFPEILEKCAEQIRIFEKNI
ncbi:hypothetical protein [Leptospira kanakyensis]|uniref:hypothetical protein n=1 Tax=Leptospira kanakyensis TaxID=2484968 RepID=UPI00223E6056|nr:hypothetical protein [Leptospira kanakyensis]MCW7483286.1 hypothetical protein [Leptospira kanakyensis]